MQMIPFAPKPLAARKQQVSAFNAALAAGVSAGGFPVVSIKGKVFHISRGGEKTLVTKPGEDDPAASIEVILVAANINPSRVYYKKGYEEGSDAKPDCYSNNGKTPEDDSQNPQAKTCATCVHAQYGSRISESGVKGWACANSRRLAIVPIGDLEDPMLIRVPGATLKTLAAYARELDGHGYQFDEVVTKIGFDYSVAHPALTFKATSILPDEGVAKIRELAQTDTVAQIIGTMAMPHDDTQTQTPDSVADLPKKEVEAPKATAKATAKAESKAAKLDEVVEAAEAKPSKAKVKVEEEPTADAGLEGDLDDMLDGVDFDA